MPDLANGKLMFTIGGCISCHKPGKDQANADPDLPSGGAPLKTPIGILYPPNLTPDASTGIGSWSHLDFLNATMRGVSPKDTNYIPAFPYTSYAAMKAEDLLDIEAYLRSLPPVAAPAKAHEIWFTPVIRRGVGLWKHLGLDTTPWRPDPQRPASWNRGSYLVNGPGHCAECHSPRNILGGIVASQRFAGGPSPDGEDFVPNITPKGLSMSHEQLVKLLETGETPDGDTVGGEMAKVTANTGKLSGGDRAAIATYVKSLPPVEGPKRPESK